MLPKLKKLLNFERHLIDLELEASLYRKSKFLDKLVLGWISIHIIALAVMFIPPLPRLEPTLIVGASFIISISVYYLNYQKLVQIAANIFCLSTNLTLILAFIFSIINNDPAIAQVMLGSLLSLGILFAGMLIHPKAILWFTFANGLSVLLSFILTRDSLVEGLGFSFPIIVFLTLIAITSWLYQTTLNQALDNLTQARREAANAELLEREFKIAQELQQSLYPEPPDYEGRICFAARSEPAHHASGDFYDFIELDQNKLGIVVADVAGKSMSAALVMAMTRSIIRHAAQPNLSPGDVLQETHQTAINDTHVDQMITCFYGLLDLQTLQLEFANAGHPYPIIKRNGDLQILEVPGLPLNAFSEAEYETQIIQLQPGDQVLWISDGIVEASNGQRDLFGFERLEATFRRIEGKTPEVILTQLWHAVLAHCDNTPQEDDLTVVIASIDADKQSS